MSLIRLKVVSILFFILSASLVYMAWEAPVRKFRLERSTVETRAIASLIGPSENNQTLEFRVSYTDKVGTLHETVVDLERVYHEVFQTKAMSIRYSKDSPDTFWTDKELDRLFPGQVNVVRMLGSAAFFLIMTATAIVVLPHKAVPVSHALGPSDSDDSRTDPGH